MDQEGIDLFKVSEQVSAWRHALSFERLRESETVFLCVWELEAEVNNGGFDQYYFNDAGRRAIEAANSLAAIGADHMANIVREANGLFGQAGPSPDRNTRQGQLLALPESTRDKMNELDANFRKYPDDLEQLLKAFVWKNREAFLASPQPTSDGAPASESGSLFRRPPLA